MKTLKILVFFLITINSYSQLLENQWVWIKGSKLANEDISEFGLIGLDDSNNWPIGRSFSSGVVDNNGNFLLFGGWIDVHSVNELWSYNYLTNNWTFKKGSLNKYISGRAYSKGIGIEHYRNKPTTKSKAQIWKDNIGNVWVFGGTIGGNDLWKYNTINNNWIQINDGTQFPLGNYGTKGVASPTNIPPYTQGAVTWTDLNGNLWMFGGETPNVNNTTNSSNDGFYNSLWKYDIITGYWTWMSGSSLLDQAGNYAVLGAESALNIPGARANSGNWIDTSGNLWLFGGTYMNDIWKYNPITNLWTWVKGSASSVENIVTISTEHINNMPLTIGLKKGSYWKDNNDKFWYYDGSANNRMWMYNPTTNCWSLKKELYSLNPIYGQLGISNPSNTIGRRTATTTWTSPNGDLYLFSGNYDSDNCNQDIWKYDISVNEWTFVKGTANPPYQRIKLTGLDDQEVNPGYMQNYCSKWTDSQGNLWLFGIQGSGYDGSNEYNDLWKFDSSSKKWKWIKGLFDYPHNQSIYPTNGQIGVEDFKNNPLNRTNSPSWIDHNDNLWLFGGGVSTGYKNDLWKYNKQTNMWVMINGSSIINQYGNYGQQGVLSASNIPGARSGGSTWVDSQGNFWLYGGNGYSSTSYGSLNDLWKYDVSINQWVWVKGSNLTNQPESSAGIGITSTTNSPPPSSNYDGVFWYDSSGTFWLYRSGSMWKFNNNNWTKVKAFSSISYGTMGVYSPTNSPGYRSNSATWIDANGNLLLFGSKGSSTSYQDLWKFDVSVNQWVWIGGKNDNNSSLGAKGNYGIQNESFISNLPGGRYRSASWKDNNNNLYLFGGDGFDENNSGFLSDIWMSNKNFNVVKGNIKLNTNNNNCLNSTTNVVNAKIAILDNSTLKTIYTNNQGNYSEIINGNAVTITPTLDYFSFNPPNQSSYFSGIGNTQQFNFCASSNGIINDLEVTIIPLNQAVSGTDVKYKIVYRNKGTSTLSGNISLNYPESISDFISTTVNLTSQSSGLLNWNFINLIPFESRSINVVLNLNSPTEIPPVNIGTIINSSVTINSNTNDQTPNDNVFNLSQTAVNSFDPNDKTCLEGNIVGTDKIGEYVNYLIRFENTGTAIASNIVIKDEIDLNKFDISSLVPVDSSHYYRLAIYDSNKIEIIFENINLLYPTSSLRYGYFVFKIKTKNNLVSGDFFSNSASIYFDYNYPIITNTSTTNITSLSTYNIEDNIYSVFPNPADNFLNLKSNQNDTIKSVKIFNSLGQMVFFNSTNKNQIDVSTLKTGTYFIKIQTETGIYNSKFIKK